MAPGREGRGLLPAGLGGRALPGSAGGLGAVGGPAAEPLWQLFQANTSGREVVRRLQALLGVLEQPDLAEDSSAYGQARAKLGLPLLEQARSASALSAQEPASRPRLLQGRLIQFVDASTGRLEDTPATSRAFPFRMRRVNRPLNSLPAPVIGGRVRR